MVYAAVISLKHTIQRLLDSSRISIAPSSRETIEFAHEEVRSLQEVLERWDDSSSRSGGKGLRALDGEIREAAHKLEDVLESRVSSAIVSNSESSGDDSHPFLFSIDRQDLIGDIHSLTRMTEKMEDYFDELHCMLRLREEEEDYLSSIVFGERRRSAIFGLGEEASEVKYMLTGWSSELRTLSLVGTVGIGKTTLAEKIFDDPYILSHFDCRAWVTLGPKYQLIKVPREILAQVDPSSDEMLKGGDEVIVERLKGSLTARRYLIVLDDVRDQEVCPYLQRLLPENNNGSRVLLTTRLSTVAGATHRTINKRLLNLHESWYLFREKVFCEGLCPPELEKAGKKIGGYFGEGHPLIVIVVAHILSQAKKTAEFWRTVARKENLAFMDAYDQISEEVLGITEDLQLVGNSFPDDDNALSSTADSGGNKSRMVISSDEAGKINDLLLDGWRSSGLGIISLVGMAGIGKTTLAKKVFKDPFLCQYFDIRVWVTIGPKYKLRRTLLNILAQVEPGINFNEMLQQELQDLASLLYGHLMGRKYLIVLDDVWNIEVWNHLKISFRDKNIGSRVLLTTRLEEVAPCAENSRVHHKYFLNEEESWDLLRHKVFGEGSCDSQLAEAGKKIAVNCEGLPLTIVTVANLLSKAEKTPEYWNKVVEKQNSVFEDAYDQMAKILYPSYEYLSPQLKACFLYLGVFPQTYKIPCSRLIKLWSTETFLEPDPPNSFKDFAVKCLKELASKSLLVVHERNYNDQIKICRLHSAFWYLCKTEAQKSKFFHLLNSHADGLAEGIKNQRRLCIHNNTLFGIKEAYNSMASTSTARSLLCTGPPHQYPVPVCFCLMLLRVLDALTICFYEFPAEVVKLVQLRIKTPGDRAYLPIEIWKMKELKHLQIMGSNLPDPCGALLPNLLTLLDVSVDTCTEGVLESVPKLKKLGIRIELEPDAAEPLRCFDHISNLRELESFKCVIVNPELRSPLVALPPHLPIFPPGLKKLTLSGFGYPWDYMRMIGLLPNLEVLKLLCYAFRGSEWRNRKVEFLRLQYLMLEDTDLVYWKADDGCFPDLKRVIIRHCYLLKEIPLQILSGLCKLELVDCSPSTSNQVKKDQKVV